MKAVDFDILLIYINLCGTFTLSYSPCYVNENNVMLNQAIGLRSQTKNWGRKKTKQKVPRFPAATKLTIVDKVIIPST